MFSYVSMFNYLSFFYLSMFSYVSMINYVSIFYVSFFKHANHQTLISSRYNTNSYSPVYRSFHQQKPVCSPIFHRLKVVRQV